jgi:hypothetical protein
VRAFNAGVFSGTFRPQAAQMADLNGDGILDLVAVNDTTSVAFNGGVPSLSVSLGKSGGSFAAPTLYGLNSASVAVAIADFNKDGHPDLVGSGSVIALFGPPIGSAYSLLLGNGDGTFQAAQNPPGSVGTTTAIAAGDVDDDGNPDIVAADSGGQLQFYKGNGDGTFASPVGLGFGLPATQIFLVKLGGSNLSSIVGGGGGTNVEVVVQTAADTFAPPVISGVANYRAMTVASFSAAPPDLAVLAASNPPAVVTYNDISSFTATALTPSQTIALPSGTVLSGLSGGIAAADVNGSGGDDLLVTDFNHQQLYTILNTGNPAAPYATTATALACGVGGGASTILSGDVDRDGKTDIVTVNASDNSASLALGKGDGTYRTAVQTAWTPSGTVANPGTNAAVADFDNDGHLDAATGQAAGGTGANLFMGTATGVFAPPIAVVNPADNGPSVVVAADFNGDGKPDLASINGGASRNVRVYLNSGGAAPFNGVTGVSTSTSPTLTAGAIQAVAADLGNGHGDLVLTDGTTVGVLLGDGSGAFPSSLNLTLGSAVAVGDMNADGKPDIVVGDSGGNLKIYLNNGSGTGFSLSASLSTGSTALVAVAVGDFSADGKADVFAATSNALFLASGTGSGTLSPQPLSFAGFRNALGSGEQINRNALVAVDINGDGQTDLVIGTTYKIGVLLNGSLGTLLGFDTDHSPGVPVAGDVDGDGHLDLVVSNSGVAAQNGSFVLSSILQH